MQNSVTERVNHNTGYNFQLHSIFFQDDLVTDVFKLSCCCVYRFIGNLLKLLICNNEKFGPQIQKHVKELVGHELNSAIYPILFDQIKICVDKFFDSSGQVSVGSIGNTE